MRHTHIIPALFLSLLVASSSFGQDSITKEFDAWPLTCSELGSTKTVYCTFQNREYQHIVDIEGIGFSSKTDVKEFCDDLNEALVYVTNKNKDEATWTTPNVDARITAPFVGKSMYIATEDGYFTITAKPKHVTHVVDGLNAAANHVWGE